MSQIGPSLVARKASYRILVGVASETRAGGNSKSYEETHFRSLQGDTQPAVRACVPRNLSLWSANSTSLKRQEAAMSVF